MTAIWSRSLRRTLILGEAALIIPVAIFIGALAGALMALTDGLDALAKEWRQ